MYVQWTIPSLFDQTSRENPVVYKGGNLQNVCFLTELCPANYSYCPSDETCLPSSWWCDGKADCSAGEDEGIYCRKYNHAITKLAFHSNETSKDKLSII